MEKGRKMNKFIKAKKRNLGKSGKNLTLDIETGHLHMKGLKVGFIIHDELTFFGLDKFKAAQKYIEQMIKKSFRKTEQQAFYGATGVVRPYIPHRFKRPLRLLPFQEKAIKEAQDEIKDFKLGIAIDGRPVNLNSKMFTKKGK